MEDIAALREAFARLFVEALRADQAHERDALVEAARRWHDAIKRARATNPLWDGADEMARLYAAIARLEADDR